MAPVISVDGVSKRYRLYRERNQSLKAAIMRGGRASYDEFWALKDVTFDIQAGRTFGLVGENGSGKSTMLKCIARILQPDRGRIEIDGKIAALLELGSGFHPELSGRENVYLNGSILGLSKREIDGKFDEILSFAGVEKFIDQPVKTYSSGMYVRLGFSVAINVDPDILLVDEILAVGDAAFQEKCMEKFHDFRVEGRTVVVVSHAMGTMRTFCDEVAWLENGTLVSVGKPAGIIDDYIDGTHAERGSTTEGATRWGSGEAVIERVTLVDAEGAPTVRACTGERVTIRIEYDARERIESPVFGLAIENMDGVHVWAHHTRDAGLDIDVIKGAGIVEYDVPALALQQGTFDVHASIVDHRTTHTYDYIRAACRFDVDNGPRRRESGGIVTLGGRFSHSAKAEAGEAG